MAQTAIVVLKLHKREQEHDIEVPLDISANDLVIAINEAYHLGVDTDDFKNCYLKCENPIVLLRGNRALWEFGIHDGSIIHFTE